MSTELRNGLADVIRGSVRTTANMAEGQEFRADWDAAATAVLRYLSCGQVWGAHHFCNRLAGHGGDHQCGHCAAGSPQRAATVLNEGKT